MPYDAQRRIYTPDDPSPQIRPLEWVNFPQNDQMNEASTFLGRAVGMKIAEGMKPTPEAPEARLPPPTASIPEPDLPAPNIPPITPNASPEMGQNRPRRRFPHPAY